MSSASLMMNKSFGLSSACSSSFMETDKQELAKQGIGTILVGSDVVSENSRAASLRRTLSADMSSKKWLAQNGISPMKKIASSEQLSMAVIPDSSSSSEEEEEFDNSWRSSVKDEDHKKKEVEKTGQFDIWSSIISDKANNGDEARKSLSPPYIHPLVKISASKLSENSLKICTESLGSETGSDGFSSCPASETSSDVEEVTLMDKEEEEEEDQQARLIISDTIGEEFHPKKSVLLLPPPRSFPPPIQSLSDSDGASLRMQARRHNGRLVLEAVPIPFRRRNFQAQRQDGRLVLSFLNTIITGTTSSVLADADDQEEKKIDKEEEFDEKFASFMEEEEEKSKIDDDDDDDEEEEIEKQIEMEEVPKLSSRMINFHRLAVMMSNKPIGLANMNQAWPSKFNEDDQHQQMVPTAQSLPPRSPTAARIIPSSPAAAAAAAANAATAKAAASFNAYEYYWRGNSTATMALKPLERNTNTIVISKNELMANHEDDHQNLVVLKGNYKADYLVPFLKGCKKPTSCTSLLFWEPHCIATS